MRLVIIALFIFLPTIAFSEDRICPKIESKGEGHWPIPEEAFTAVEAEKTINKLNELLKISISEIDDFPGKIQNHTVMIKGYMYKKQIKELEAKSGNKSYFARKEFCDFLRNEAYVVH